MFILHLELVYVRIHYLQILLVIVLLHLQYLLRHFQIQVLRSFQDSEQYFVTRLLDTLLNQLPKK